MKKIYNKFLFSSLSLATLLFVSCSKDDYTGYSTVEVTNGAKLTVTSDFSSPKTIVEGDNKYTLTVSIDKPQSFDVVVKINQIDGSASTDDYTVEGKITIPAYKTSAKTELVILKDDLKEDVETLKLQIGDINTSNASLTPVTIDFNIQNYTEGSLIADLSWETSIKDVNGDLIKSTDAADFKLRITNLDFSDVEVVDDSKTAFESYEMLASLADGEYFVVAEPVSFIDLGAQGNFDVDLKVNFNQVGIYNDESFEFKKAISSASMTSCGSIGFFKLAKITKSGISYTFSEIGESESKFKGSDFVGNYEVTLDEWHDYSVGDIVPVNYNSSDGTASFRLNSTNNSGVTNPTTSYILIKFDPNTGDVISAVTNENLDYGINGDAGVTSGTGKVDYCTKSIKLTLAWGPNGSYGKYKFNLEKL